MKKTSGMNIANHKKRGQWAELRFMAKAMELGYQIAKPLGDTAQYDAVLEVRGHFVSVQIKSTYFQAGNLKPGNFVASLYHVNGPNRRYEREDFDFLAVYCIPTDVWYIIPSAVASEKHAIRVCPGDELNQFEHYREALVPPRRPRPLSAPASAAFNIYAIVENYTPPPKIKRSTTPIPPKSPRRPCTPKLAGEQGPRSRWVRTRQAADHSFWNAGGPPMPSPQ